MKLFLGDKNTIGIEMLIAGKDDLNNLVGNARLWFNGNFFGTLCDKIYLDGYLLGGLYQLLKVGEIPSNFNNLNKEYQFNYLINIDDPSLDNYRVSFGTFTDPFEVRAYKNEEYIIILWRLFDKETLFEDLQNYPTGVHKAEVNFDDLSEITSRLSKIIRSW